MAVIDELKKDSILNYTEDGKIIVIPLSRFEFQTNPIETENHLTITEDDYVGLRLRVYQFTEDLHGIEPFDNTAFNKFLTTRFKRKTYKEEGE